MYTSKSESVLNMYAIVKSVSKKGESIIMYIERTTPP